MPADESPLISELRSQFDELSTKRNTIDSEMAKLADLSSPTAGQLDRLERLQASFPQIEEATNKAGLALRSARIDHAKSLPGQSSAPGYHVPQSMRRVETSDLDVTRMDNQELRSAALKVVELEGTRLTARQLDHVDKTIRSQSSETDGVEISRRVLITERDVYKSAFAKGVTDPQPKWTSEEIQALNEFRAMADSPTSAGGYGVPVLIDPSIILTAGAASAPVLDICRIITSPRMPGRASRPLA